jgi:hypothetical protein
MRPSPDLLFVQLLMDRMIVVLDRVIGDEDG